MQVILLQHVKNLGSLGEKVKVRSGYGRNFLVPRGMALAATPANMEVFEQRRAELETAATDLQTRAEARIARFEGLEVVIKVRVADDEGKLYGSVGPSEIAHACTEAGVELNKSEIDMPEGIIRKAGEHTVAVQLHAEVQAQLKVRIEAE